MKTLSRGKILSFTRGQRSGLILFLLIVMSVQGLYFYLEHGSPVTVDENHNLHLAIDSLKQRQSEQKPKIYPFNPNFITDFKGYRLGMSVEEIDRLLAFRRKNKYVKSAAEFQQVTKVSDSLLAAISPYFKFPDWVANKKQSFHREKFSQRAIPVVKDINQATADDLIAVYGIGPALSERILKQKEKLGGFVSMEQMADIWGLSEEVVGKLKEAFNVAVPPTVNKININTASVRELSQFPYFRYPLSKEIVTFRSMNGGIKNAEDLARIRNFPVDKVEIITVYLEF